MIKVMAFFARKPGLSREEFLKYWSEVHGPLAVPYFPAIRKYVQNHLPPDAELGFDGIGEFWYDDMEGLQSTLEIMQSEVGKNISDEEEGFMDTGKMVFFVVEEKVIK